MMRCIAVDDEKLVLDLLVDNIQKVPFLQLAGRCRNAMEAAELLHQESIDLIFLDIQMPGMDGLELTRRLRALSGDDIVLIAMTGREPRSGDVTDAFALVDHCLHKPFDIAKLEQVLPPLSSFQSQRQEPA